MHLRILRRAAIAAACGAFVVGIAQAQTLTVEIEFANATPLADSEIEVSLGGAPMRMVARGRTTTIETDDAGYKHLLANSDIHSVRIVTGRPADATREADVMSFRIRLTTIPRESVNGPAMDLAAARTATHRALLLSQTRASEVIRLPSEAGPGTLTVRGVTAGGEEIVRAVVEDPRLVRLETTDRDGRFQRRRDFISTDASLSVTLPVDRRIARLTISEFGADGERQIAQVPVR